MRHLPLLLVGVSMLVGASCATRSEPEVGPLSSEGATVEVTNNNWLDMTVYAARGGMRARLGLVNTMTTRRFAIPRNLVNGATAIQLIADPVGGQSAYTTELLNVWPGETVEFTIEGNSDISTVSVWEE